MSKFSDLPHYILEEYFNQSISQGTRNTDISGPYHRYDVLDDMVGSSLSGNRQSIVATGGHWVKLWIKMVDFEGEVPDYPGFVEFQFKINSNYLEDDLFIFEVGSMLTIAASANGTVYEVASAQDPVVSNPSWNSYSETRYIPAKTINYGNIQPGSEIYFKKGTYLYEWLVKNSSDYRDCFNTNKTFLYFGKIYTHRDVDNTYHIIYDGMKNYVMNALPRENRTDKLTEFMRLYFDKVYHPIHNKMKDLSSLLDPKEVDIRFIDYLARAYLIDTDINLSEVALREWVENLVYILKRKGTYSSLFIIWKTFLKNTLNNINIYERWHEATLLEYPNENADIPLGKFADILHDINYGIVPEGCSGHYWYDKILHAISPGVVFIQNTPSTVWYIAHTMYSKDVFVQCYSFDTDQERIWPASVQPLSTGMVKVTFGESVQGYAYLMRRGDFNHSQSSNDSSWTINHNLGQKEVLTQFKDDNYLKIMPANIKLDGPNGLTATFGDAESGISNVRSETLGTNFVVVDKSSIAASTWNCNHGLYDLGALTDSNRGVFVQTFTTGDEMLNPYSISLVDQNNCTITFTESVSGYAIFKASELNDIILPEYDLTDMILSPHYKVEVDLSCEPLDDDDGYILSQETIERLMTNWELMRPVTRYSHYHILISPITNFTGEYRSLYGPGYDSSLYTKFCLSAGELQPESTSEEIYFKQYVNSDIWKISHYLDSDDFIIQCYDGDNNRIWPDKVKTIGNSNIEIHFGYAVRGAASIIETTSALTSASTIYFDTPNLPSWDVEHNLGVLEVLNQFDDSTRSKINPSGMSLEGENNALAIWNENIIGKGYSLSSAVSYVHVELTASNTWSINHNLSSNSIVSQFFDNDNNIITPISLTINNSDYCTAEFADDIAGYAVLRKVNKKITEVDIMGLLQDYGYWELGSGTSKSDYDPLTNDGVETLLISGGIGDYETVSTSGGLTSYGYSDDSMYYYLSNEVTNMDANLEDWEVTEIAWLTIIDGVRKVRFYSYFDPIYKPDNMWFNSHMRIEKSQS